MEELIAELKGLKEELGSSKELQQKAFDAFKKANDERMEKEMKGLGVSELKDQINKMSDDLQKHEDIVARVGSIETAIKRQVEAGAPSGKILTPEKKEYQDALCTYLRKGHEGMPEHKLEELATKAMTVQSDPDGGYFVETDKSGQMVDRYYETSPWRQYASVQTISTSDLEGPVKTNKSNAKWQGETDDEPSRDTPTYGRWRIPVWRLEVSPLISQKLLEDSTQDPIALVMADAAEEFMLKENDAFTNGDGNKKPFGINFYGDNIANDWQRGVLGTIISENDDAISFNDLIKLQYATKAIYRSSEAIYAMNRSTTGQVRLLTDNEGQYLWQPSNQAGQPASLLGFSVAEFNDLEDIADGTAPVYFGNFRRGYQIVDRIGMRVLVDPYTKKPFVEVWTYKRVGGDVIDFDAIKRLRIQ